MIDRYTTPEMAHLWSLENKYHHWLTVELAVLAAQEAMCFPDESTQLVDESTTMAAVKAPFEIPKGTHTQISALLMPCQRWLDTAAVEAIEATVKHDVIAFMTHVGDVLNQKASSQNLGRFLHLGMTSSDLVDTALSLQMQQAGRLILQASEQLKQAILTQAQAHLHTVCIGRSHGIHGEPTTFGLKLYNWLDELERQHARFEAALADCAVGQMTGAVGTYAHNPPEVELRACQILGLTPARITSQVIGRDRHASYLLALAQYASSMERWVIEIRHLQRTEVLEAEEPFSVGQKGSSAMPHKRNPIGCENLTGLARLLRSYAVPALENIALWHERDISHSSVERVILPDATTLMHYMLKRFAGIVAGLQIYPQNMARNLNAFGGIVFSQRVLLALVNAGLSREVAYQLVQRNAMAIWNTPDGNFRQQLCADSDVRRVLSAEAIATCFDVAPMLAHVNTIASRF
jgi:adenylosuccinate lyase